MSTEKTEIYDDEYEMDPLDEIIQADPEVVNIHQFINGRVGGWVGECREMSKLTYPNLRKALEPGTYQLQGKASGRIVINRHITLGSTALTDDSSLGLNTEKTRKEHGSDSGINTVHNAPSGSSDIKYMVELIKDMLEKQQNNSQQQPDFSKMYDKMYESFSLGIQKGLDMMPKGTDPADTFKLVERVLDIKDRIEVNDSGMDLKERIFGSVFPVLKSAFENNQDKILSYIGGLNPPSQPGSQGSTQGSKENPESDTADQETTQETTRKEKITFWDYFNHYTYALSQRIKVKPDLDAEVRAAAFIEDISVEDPELYKQLQDVCENLRNDDGTQIMAYLVKSSQHIAEHPDWFKEFLLEIKSIVLYDNNSDDDTESDRNTE